jgi:flagellar protein FlaG
MQILLSSTRVSVDHPPLSIDGERLGMQPSSAPATGSTTVATVDATTGVSLDKKEVHAKLKDIERAVNNTNDFFQTVNRELRFEHSDFTDNMVVQIIDKKTGQIVHQFPSEKMLKIAKELEMVSGLLFKDSA